MTATKDAPPSGGNTTDKSRAQTSAGDPVPWLDALDHLDTAESIILTVLRRMGSEEDWGPEQTTLLVGIEYLSRVAQRIRHHVDQNSRGK